MAERADIEAKALPCPSELYRRARKIRELATIAMESLSVTTEPSSMRAG